MLPERAIEPLRVHLERVRELHQADLAVGAGWVMLGAMCYAAAPCGFWRAMPTGLARRLLLQRPEDPCNDYGGRPR